MEKNFEIETKDISMSDKCKYDLKAISFNNSYSNIENWYIK